MVKRVGLLCAEHRREWDDLAGRHASFMQSWAWSELKELEGYTVLRLGLWNDRQLLGGGFFYGHQSLHEGELWVAPGGPLLDWSYPDDWKLLLNGVRNSALTQRAILLRIEPMLDELPSCLQNSIRAPSDLIPAHTLEIRLGTADEILSRMKPKGRYNSRLALRKGVDMVLSENPLDIHELYRVLEHTARYQGFILEPRSFFVNLASCLLPSMGQLVFARWHGMTLAAGFVVKFGNTVTYLYGGHLPIFSNQMASYAMHWHIMKMASQSNFKHYDMYGYVSSDQPAHPYYGFSRFKERLGGVPHRRIGSRDIVFYDRLANLAKQVVGGTVL